MRTSNAITIVLAIVMMIGAPLAAADRTWIAPIDPGLWDTVTNWDGGAAAPASGDNVTFDGAAGVMGVVDMNGLALSVGNLAFSGIADGFDISDSGSGAIDVTGILASIGSGANTISGALTMGAGSEIKVNAGTLRLSNATTGAAKLDINGGILDLTGSTAPTFTTLDLGFGPWALYMTGQGTIKSDDNVTLGAGPVVLDAGSALFFEGGGKTLAGSTFVAHASGGTSATIGVDAGSTFASGNLNLYHNTTLVAAGGGAQTYTDVVMQDATTASTINFTGAGTVTADAYHDNGNTSELNITGGGTFAIAGGGAVVAGNTTFKVGGSATLAVDSLAVMGATTVSLDGGTFKTQGAPGGTPYQVGLQGSLFRSAPRNDTWLNLEGSTYVFDLNRVFTGSKTSTILDPAKEEAGYNIAGDFGSVACANNNDWGPFPTLSSDWEDFVTAYSGRFTASETGSYRFHANIDDRAWMWIDMDNNGTFDTGENVGAYGGAATGNKDLVSGQSYNVVIMGHEWGGGRTINWYVDSPTGPDTMINTNGVNQGGVWEYGSIVYGAIDMSTTDIIVNDVALANTSQLIATTDFTATFGALTLTKGLLTVSGAEGGTIFSGGTTVAVGSPVGTGIASANDVTLGALTIGAGADVTFDSPNTTATSLALDTSATIRANGVFNAGTYNDLTLATALTQAGTGTMNLLNLGATDAAATIFEVLSGTLAFSGATPLGGSTAALLLNGGTMQITADAASDISLTATDVTVSAASTLRLITDATYVAALRDVTLVGGVLTVDGPVDGTTFNSINVNDGANTGLISAKPLFITSGGLTVMNTNPGLTPNQNFTLGGSFAIPGTLTLGADAKVSVDAGNVTAPTLVAAGNNTFAFTNAGTLRANNYNDASVPTIINVEGDGSGGKLLFTTDGVGTIAAGSTTFNVKSGGILEGRDVAPMGAAGVAMLNLDGGTALFSVGGKVYMPEGLTAHFDAGAGVTTSGGTVTLWEDQSGNGFDATPHVGTPTLITNAVNGLPTVEFTSVGGNDALGVDHDLFAKEMYFVWRNLDDSLTHNGLFGKQTGGRGSTFIFDANGQTFHGNQSPESWARDGVTGVNNDFHLSGPKDEFMILKVVVNDNDTVAEPYYISGVDNNSRAADWFISEIMAFDTALSAADETAVGAYLAQKYNLPTAYTGAAIGDPLATGDLNMTNTPVTVLSSSTLEAVTDGDAHFGALVFNTAARLRTAGAHGAITFDGTTLAAGINEFNTAADTNPGAITVLGTDAVTILKTGKGDLVLDSGDPDLTGGGTLAFDVQAGRLIGVASSVPFGPGPIDINGGEVVLVGTGPASSITFNNAFDVIGAGGALTAGLVGSGTGGSRITVNNLTLTAGTLTLQTSDTNTLILPNGVTGPSGVAVAIAGDVEVDTIFSVDTLIMSGGTITPTGTLTGITVDSALSLTGGDLDLVASGLTLDTTANTVLSITGGNTLTLNQATLGAINPLAGLAVNNSTMIGHATSTTVTFDGIASLVNATLIRINLAGTGGIAVSTSPDPDGFVDLGAGPHTYSGDTIINYGALVVDSPATLSANSNLKLDADDAGVPAVLLTEGTFDRAIGVAAGEVQWSDNGGGFAAKGAGLDVNIGGLSAALTWAADLNDKVLQFGHGIATAKVDFQNAIDLGAAERTVFVADNAASSTDIAEISGDLTNGTLKKTGVGTLDITGAATALTGTNIENGAIRIGDGVLNFAKLGTIALLGNTNIDDDVDVQSNHQIGVIETSRVATLFVNPTTGTDLGVTFTNSSVGISNSSATPLMVAIGGDTAELEAASRIRTINWDTESASLWAASQPRAPLN